MQNLPVEMQGKGIRFAGWQKFNNARELCRVSQCPTIVIGDNTYIHNS
jgi:hypothetical protein